VALSSGISATRLVRLCSLVATVNPLGATRAGLDAEDPAPIQVEPRCLRATSARQDESAVSSDQTRIGGFESMRRATATWGTRRRSTGCDEADSRCSDLTVIKTSSHRLRAAGIPPASLTTNQAGYGSLSGQRTDAITSPALGLVGASSRSSGDPRAFVEASPSSATRDPVRPNRSCSSPARRPAGPGRRR